MSAPRSSIPKLSHDDMVTKAEVYETLRVCLADQSFASTSGISDLMRSMFPDSKIANDMKLQRTKMAYLACHGIAPFLEREFRSDVLNSKLCFSITFDETTTVQTKKQLDIGIVYWSPNPIWRNTTSQGN